MTDDPANKSNQPGRSGQQQHSNPESDPKKRLPKSEHDIETDEENERDEGVQRRAS